MLQVEERNVNKTEATKTGSIEGPLSLDSLAKVLIDQLVDDPGQVVDISTELKRFTEHDHHEL